ISGLVVRGSVGYYTSVYSGHVGRIDLLTGKTAWVRSVSVGVRAPALVAGRVVVASPATGTVTALAIGDGHVVARRSLHGTPYGVAASRGHLYVSLARTNQIAELAPDTLRRLATFRVPHGPRNVITQGDRVWVSSTLAHVLAAAGTSAAASPVRQLLTSVQDPEISGNAGWLAVQGMEWVTLLSPTGQLTRTPLPDPHIISLLVQSDGSVIVGYQ